MLSEHGRPYLVGGCVRDIYLGRPVHDLDIEVHGIEAEELGRIVASRLGTSGEQVGRQFGVYKVGRNIDVSLPRTETRTGEKHTDFDVQTVPHLGLKEAARRRDFTMNALMYDLNSKETKDFFGGLSDIEQKTIRHVDRETFTEDGLRVYRAAQFAARFGFDVVDETMELARSMDLSFLPRERVYEEWKKMLGSGRPSIGLQALDDMGVLERYYPELHSLKDTPQREDVHAEGDVFTHTKMVADSAAETSKRFLDERDRLAIMLAAVAHDLGKPATTRFDEERVPTQHGHETELGPVRRFLSKLTNEPSLIDDILFLVERHLTPLQFHRSKASDSAFRRQINRHGMRRLGLLAAVAEADATGRLHRNPDGSIERPDSTGVDWFSERLADVASKHDLTREGRLDPLIGGADLIGLGLEPGPRFGEVLRDVQAQQESGGLKTKEDTLAYVRERYGV